MYTKSLTTKLMLPALLAAGFAGCRLPARELPYALTHQIASVPTEGMSPAIKPGDHIAVKVGYYDELPVERFDIVAYKHRPENQPYIEDVGRDAETLYVSRVIGLSGEKVEFREGKVFVNGRLLEEPFETVPPVASGSGHDPGRPVVFVPAGEYLLVGDNRANSFDGRYWDMPTLSKRYLHGKVTNIFPQQQDAARPAATP
jgi:signal peptidase I